MLACIDRTGGHVADEARGRSEQAGFLLLVPFENVGGRCDIGIDRIGAEGGDDGSSLVADCHAAEVVRSPPLMRRELLGYPISERAGTRNPHPLALEFSERVDG